MSPYIQNLEITMTNISITLEFLLNHLHCYYILLNYLTNKGKKLEWQDKII